MLPYLARFSLEGRVALVTGASSGLGFEIAKALAGSGAHVVLNGRNPDRLEEACDRYNADLEALRSFILPGGSPAAARLHVCRTVARRAERSAWAAYSEHGEAMNAVAITYLNRLSDLLFILARHANGERGDLLWQPGGER